MKQISLNKIKSFGLILLLALFSLTLAACVDLSGGGGSSGGGGGGTGSGGGGNGGDGNGGGDNNNNSEISATLPPAEAEDIVSNAPAANELYSSIEGSTDGAEIYKILCTKCHGLGGLGDGPSTGSLSTQSGMNLTTLQDRSDEELMTTISEGKGIEMPAWALILNREQREVVLEYVRTLGQ